MVPSPMLACRSRYAHLDLLNETSCADFAGVVEPAGPEMLRVDAQTETVVVVARVDHHLNLLESATNRTVQARRILNEDGALGHSFRRRIGLIERALEGISNLAHDGVESGPLVRADV
jgi:hypothetical protein